MDVELARFDVRPDFPPFAHLVASTTTTTKHKLPAAAAAATTHWVRVVGRRLVRSGIVADSSVPNVRPGLFSYLAAPCQSTRGGILCPGAVKAVH